MPPSLAGKESPQVNSSSSPKRGSPLLGAVAGSGCSPKSGPSSPKIRALSADIFRTYTKTTLSDNEVLYYSRQLKLPGFELEGQLALLNSSVLVIGAGGLGSSLIPSLAGMGLKSITVVDFDNIEVSNLHRQTIHGIHDQGRFKAESAADRIRAINPQVEIETVCDRLTPNLCDELFPKASIIADCSDNLPTRLLVSDYADKHSKPVVSGSALRFQGQILIYGIQGDGKDNYRSLLGEQCARAANVPKETASGLDAFLQKYIEAPQSCESAGIFGPVCAVIGSLMATNLAKILLGYFREDPRSYNFLLYDFTNQRHPLRTLRLRPKKTLEPKPADYDAGTCPTKAPGPRHLSLDETITNSSWSELMSQGLLSKGEGSYCGAIDTVFCDVRSRAETKLPNLRGNVTTAPVSTLLSVVMELSAALKELPHSPGKVDHAMSRLAGLITGRDPARETLPKRVYIYCRRGIASVDACNIVAAARVALCSTQYNSPICTWFLREVQFGNVEGGLSSLKQQCDGFDWIQIFS